MIYIFGKSPQWLVDVVRKLGEEVVEVGNCDVPPRSVVISISGACRARGSVVLSLLPYGNSIPIQRGTARGVLLSVVNMLRKIQGVGTMGDALSLLGFVSVNVIDVVGVAEIAVSDRVVPGSIYTVVMANKDQGEYVVALGRGTARNTLLLDSPVTWLLDNGGDTYLARGDLMLELVALSMIFGISLRRSNPPY
ncbi:hypothetical protein [Vulcanisaeta sp. JCM 16159]|uniref:hypothetical protein n=1 Tax=Vulcanisaeta sp. JCM 16159 TaxID=1295371 RepID=UPI0006CFC7A0|nr:hypothetical protein [Vulcanisaeta sp. JCM 16159]